MVYKKCVACHGAKAEKVYLNKIPALNTLEPVKMVEDMKLYKAGEMGENGTGQFKMGAVMKAQMASLSEEDMEAVVAYIQTLK
ncbi:MAG: c-type cytochrome [Campylobacter sp.]|nr:c-type cytochrome [Campylobacter sp.]